MQDSKSVFGILAGLAALFALWLWASGNYGKLKAGLTGNPAGSGVSAATPPPAGSPPGAPNTQILPASTVPNIIPTTLALSLPEPQLMGGNTMNGATSGGVSITPSALLAYASSGAPLQYA